MISRGKLSIKCGTNDRLKEDGEDVPLKHHYIWKMGAVPMPRDGHRMRIEFQNGVKHGDSYFMGPYGGVIWQGTYVKGVRHGEWVEWENGRMVFYTYDHGTEVKKETETMEGRKRIR